MKNLRILTLVGAAAFGLAGWNLVGADTTPATQITLPEPARSRWDAWQRAQRPELPAEIKALIEEAKKAQQDFVAKQLELRKQLKDATAEQRDAIKEEMKANRDKWREIQKEKWMDIRKAVAERRKEFKNNRDAVLDAAGDKGAKGRGRP
jgi:hypothetical protein